MRKNILTMILLLSFILFAKSMDSFAHFAEGITIVKEEELIEAINNREKFIVINNDINLHQALEINHHIHVSGTGTLIVTDEFRHFVIGEEGTLVLEGELTLRRSDNIRDDNRGGRVCRGGVLVEGGRFYMHGGRISYNRGWVVLVKEGGHFYLYDGEISHNIGRGVEVIDNSAFHMHGGVIKNNGSSGVVLMRHSIFNMYDGSIQDNGDFGGIEIYHESTFNMYGGMIRGNGRSGVSITRRSTFNMYDGIIKENIAVPRERFGDSSGGGVYVSSHSVFTMNGGKIINNTADIGGGVYVENSGFYLKDGFIVRNTANGSGHVVTGGGGVAVFSCMRIGRSSGYIRIFGGEISENTADFGGGIAVLSGTLQIHDGVIQGNISEGSGGGIALRMSHGVVHDGVIQGNIARGNGGGIFFDSLGSLALSGGEVRDNSATLSGGGIFARIPYFLATGSEVVFSGNTASGNEYIRMRAGKERYPNIMWAGENSILGTHLLNNHDVSYVQEQWVPAYWQMYLMLVGFVAIFMFIGAVIWYRNKRYYAKVLSVFLLVSFWWFIDGTPLMAAGDPIIVTNEQELQEALIQSEEIVVVDEVIHIENVIEIDVSVTLLGTGTITVAGNHRHFRVSQYGELTLKGDITITLAEGYEGPGGGILVVNGGTLRMYGGEITGNRTTFGRDDLGGGVKISGGVFHFNEGRIHGNTAGIGGGIGLSCGFLRLSTLIIHNGEIDNNHALINGGGVGDERSLLAGSAVMMYGGRIRNNHADFSGGGLFLENSIGRLMGGEISSNTASGHGGVTGFSFMNRITISDHIRIVDNYPPSPHDSDLPFSFAWFITPDGYRYFGVLIVAILATWFTSRRYRKRTEIEKETDMETKAEAEREIESMA